MRYFRWFVWSAASQLLLLLLYYFGVISAFSMGLIDFLWACVVMGSWAKLVVSSPPSVSE